MVAGHHDGAAAAAAAAAAGASAGEMMVQTPYGMYPYVSFQGVPYVSQQQGYSVSELTADLIGHDVGIFGVGASDGPTVLDLGAAVTHPHELSRVLLWV